MKISKPLNSSTDAGFQDAYTALLVHMVTYSEVVFAANAVSNCMEIRSEDVSHEILKSELYTVTLTESYAETRCRTDVSLAGLTLQLFDDPSSSEASLGHW